VNVIAIDGNTTGFPVAPMDGSPAETTLLYLPRSMATMVFVVAVIVIVFVFLRQAPRGGDGANSSLFAASVHRRAGSCRAEALARLPRRPI